MTDKSALRASSGLNHAPGKWAVIVGSWSPEVAEITKVTEKQVRTKRDGRTDRENHHSRSDVVFSGTEKAARDLLSALKGLNARKVDAERQLRQQHDERVKAVIAKAVSQ